jgi:hypothetical protein
MTTRRNAAHIRTGREPPGAHAFRGHRSRALMLAVAAVFTVGIIAAVGALVSHASALTNCATTLSACHYPNAANTGVPAGTVLKTVPGQVSSGPGWSYNATDKAVIVTVNGTVLSDLYIPYNLEIDASNVTVKNVEVVTGGNFAISFAHTKDVTVEDCTVSGQNLTSGRVDSAIDDPYGDSTGMVVEDNNISLFRTAIQITTGLAEGNYIHNPGYISGDHTNGFYVNGGTEPLTIEDNTIFNSLGQTDAINLDPGTPGSAVANKTIEDNFLAGGGYTIYGGDVGGSATTNIVIEGNRIGQLYYPKGGQWGPDFYFDSTGKGNVWSANIWDTTGANIPSS